METLECTPLKHSEDGIRWALFPIRDKTFIYSLLLCIFFWFLHPKYKPDRSELSKLDLSKTTSLICNTSTPDPSWNHFNSIGHFLPLNCSNLNFFFPFRPFFLPVLPGPKDPFPWNFTHIFSKLVWIADLYRVELGKKATFVHSIAFSILMWSL